MPVPTVITDLSTTAASNYPAGTDSPSTLDDVQRAHASFIRTLYNGDTTLYTPVGTGAVATTVQAKLRESVSVFDFMTAAQIADVQAGTASVDVTAAIQSALNSGAYDVFLPQGTYKTTSVLSRPVGVRLRGVGSYRSIISAAHNGIVISTAPASMSGETYNSLQDLKITNAATYTSSIGILLESLINSSVSKVRVEGGPIIGIQCHFVQFSQFSQVHIQDCTDVGWYWYSASQADGNNKNRIEDVNINYCATGLKLDTTGTIMQQFDRLSCELNTLPMDILAGSNIVFNDLYIEANTQNLKLRGGDQIVFNNPTNVSVQQFINTTSFAATNVYVNHLNDVSGGGVITNANVTLFPGQVRFPSTPKPSTNVNVLDDYKEGTWTPADNSGGGVTFSAVTCTYVKIGKKVTCSFVFTFSVTANGNGVQIGGLPYVSANNGGGSIGFSTVTTLRQCEAYSGNSIMLLRDSSGTLMTNAAMSGSTLRGVLTYEV